MHVVPSIVPFPGSVYTNTCIPDPPQVPLPGGYKIGDVVYSLTKQSGTSGDVIEVGSKGTVQGPCTDTSAADYDQIFVDFGDGTGGRWNLHVTRISKTDPTKVLSTPTS